MKTIKLLLAGIAIGVVATTAILIAKNKSDIKKSELKELERLSKKYKKNS